MNKLSKWFSSNILGFNENIVLSNVHNPMKSHKSKNVFKVVHHGLKHEENALKFEVKDWSAALYYILDNTVRHNK